MKQNNILVLTHWDFNENEIKNWDGKSQVIGSKKDGEELLIIAKPNITL